MFIYLTCQFSCSRASDFGLMKINETGQVQKFCEKPKGDDLAAMVFNIIYITFSFSCLKSIWLICWAFNISFSQVSFLMQQVDTTILGLSPEDAKKSPYIASMGIYLFKTDVLLKLLR